MRKFTVVRVSEWEGLYEGDELLYEDHSVGVSSVASRADGEPIELRVVDCYGGDLDEEVLEKGALPDELPEEARGS